MSRANPVMLSGTGSRFRYAGSCTLTMRATLSSTILTGRVRSSPRPSPSSACANSRGGRRAFAGRDPAAGGAADPGGGELPGADWQRPSDARAYWAPRRRERRRAGSRGTGQCRAGPLERALARGPYVCRRRRSAGRARVGGDKACERLVICKCL